MLEKTTKEAYSIDVAIPNSHRLQRTFTVKLQKYADLQEEITRIWQLNAFLIVPFVSSTTGIALKESRRQEVLNLRPALCLLY
jgi:hypothetical protein